MFTPAKRGPWRSGPAIPASRRGFPPRAASGGLRYTPPVPDPTHATRLLHASAAGDESAAEAFLPLVYDELRALAARRLSSERADHTLQPTELVHEAFARLIGGESVDFRDRQHFFATAARTIRRVLVDHARARLADRRGGGVVRCTLNTDIAADGVETLDLLGVDDALEQLETQSARHAQVVHLRWFAGLDVEQTAATLGVSKATVKSDWRAARAFLKRALDERSDGDAPRD